MDLMSANGRRYGAILERCRCTVVLLAVACAGLVFWWTSQRYRGAAGAVAAALVLTYPSFVASSAMVTVDVGAAAFACLAAYAFWRFLRNPSLTETVFAGACLGLAQAAKFSLLVLYPSFLLLASAIPVPLPGQYVLGFDSEKHDEECGLMCLRGGRLVHRGAWYSPMETLLFKLPVVQSALPAFATILTVYLTHKTRSGGKAFQN